MELDTKNSLSKNKLADCDQKGSTEQGKILFERIIFNKKAHHFMGVMERHFSKL